MKWKIASGGSSHGARVACNARITGFAVRVFSLERPCNVSEATLVSAARHSLTCPAGMCMGPQAKCLSTRLAAPCVHTHSDEDDGALD